MLQLLRDAVAKAVYEYLEPNSKEVIPKITEQPRPTTCVGQVRGQEDAKIGILIAACGGHDVLLVGPPGEGKTFLVSCMPGFLPLLTDDEIFTRYNFLRDGSALRPFVEVGTSITQIQLLGGGTKFPVPGLITQAHGGILYLDELPHFKREVIDALRDPMEKGYVQITRGGITSTFPSRFQLIAAMNPCPCGYSGYAECTCRDAEIDRYQKKISGPILDRIDMLLSLSSTTSTEYFTPPVPSQSNNFLARIKEATSFRELERNQYAPNSCIPGHHAADPTSNLLCWSEDGLREFKSVIDGPKFSSRKRTRLARVARTYADLQSDPQITGEHIRAVLRYTNSNILER